MREISAATITKAIRDMCIEANYGLAPDMRKVFEKAVEEEESPLGRQVLEQLKENLRIAGEDSIPICQDTGMAVVFMKIGQDVHITGERLADAVNEGVRQGYEQGYLRKSVVGDPIERINTKDNTPAVIHCEITDGEQIDITVAPKGFGSENMSRVFMLKPADGLEGGTFEKCAQMAKHALTRDIENKPEKQWVRELEEDMLKRINQSGIGPGGLGGRVTALAVNIETFATHIAGLPLAVNICCHVNRHARRVL